MEDLNKMLCIKQHSDEHLLCTQELLFFPFLFNIFIQAFRTAANITVKSAVDRINQAPTYSNRQCYTAFFVILCNFVLKVNYFKYRQNYYNPLKQAFLYT